MKCTVPWASTDQVTLTCLCSLVFFSSCSEKFRLFSFPVFWFWVYLIKVILETRRGQWIGYLYFFFITRIISRCWVITNKRYNFNKGMTIYETIFIFTLIVFSGCPGLLHQQSCHHAYHAWYSWNSGAISATGTAYSFWAPLFLY